MDELFLARAGSLLGTKAVVKECCSTCLNPVKSTTFSLAKHPWSSLLRDGIVQPAQLFNVLERREKGQLAFNGPIVNLNALHLPCKKVNCEPTCWICYGLVDDQVPTDGFPGFVMHRACSVQCPRQGCGAYLPTVPRYHFPKNMKRFCEAHTKPPEAPKRAPGPLKADPKPEPMPPPSQAQPKPQPKPQAKPAKESRLERFNSSFKNPSVKDFFGTPGQQRLRANEAEAVRAEFKDMKERVIYTHDTEEPYAYKAAGKWFRADNDEPLFRQEDSPPRKRKYDFTPPEPHKGPPVFLDPGET